MATGSTPRTEVWPFTTPPLPLCLGGGLTLRLFRRFALRFFRRSPFRLGGSFAFSFLGGLAFSFLGSFTALFFLALATKFRLASCFRLPFSPRYLGLPFCFLALTALLLPRLSFLFFPNADFVHHLRLDRLHLLPFGMKRA